MHVRLRAVLRHVALLGLGVAAATTASPRPLMSQGGSAPYTTVQQPAAWYSVFVDQAVSPRTALWFDAQWRRTGIGEAPQQILVRPGLQFTLAPGVRVGGGYSYIASAPYGEAPTATPLREQRLWQQITLAHAAGPVSVSHRYRWEQRWTAPLLGSGETGRYSYAQRARYMVRAQGDIPALRLAGTPLMAFAYEEILAPVGHADETLRLTQNRLSAGLGARVGSHQRIELGYMNLWNSLAAQRTNEVNHTFTLSWFWTASR